MGERGLRSLLRRRLSPARRSRGGWLNKPGLSLERARSEPVARRPSFSWSWLGDA